MSSIGCLGFERERGRLIVGKLDGPAKLGGSVEAAVDTSFDDVLVGIFVSWWFSAWIEHLSGLLEALEVFLERNTSRNRPTGDGDRLFEAWGGRRPVLDDFKR